MIGELIHYPLYPIIIGQLNNVPSYNSTNQEINDLKFDVKVTGGSITEIYANQGNRGINIPNVPPAVIVPAASLTSYPDLFIDFAAIIPSMVTEAPTMPVAAAKITETNKTA